MGHARKSLISLEDTPYYHVFARCVRRAWLWGYDAYASRDYSHRKTWVLQRLSDLGEVFSIDLCAYAVMSNHYHLVLRVDRARAMKWSQEEVVERWTRVFGLPPRVEEWRKGTASKGVRIAAELLIELWRARLTDISWYMRCLNEHLARRANAEDQCKGRFWEGRFKSQALLDEAGVLTAMAYVDLNPVRAGIAATPEESEFTSIHARLQRISAMKLARPNRRVVAAVPTLLPFRESQQQCRQSLPVRLHEYMQLLDWSGRSRRMGDRSRVHTNPPLILERMNIDPERWRTTTMQPAGWALGRAIGRVESLRAHAQRLGQSWIKGLRQAQRLYLKA